MLNEIIMESSQLIQNSQDLREKILNGFNNAEDLTLNCNLLEEIDVTFIQIVAGAIELAKKRKMRLNMTANDTEKLKSMLLSAGVPYRNNLKMFINIIDDGRNLNG